MYAAFYRTPQGHTGHVTLGRQVFFASRGVLEMMVDAMSKKHLTVEFFIEEVQNA